VSYLLAEASSAGTAPCCTVSLSRMSAGLGAAGELINAAVAQYVLPLTPALLADEDPMPLYALKMLGVLLDVNPSWVLPLAELGIARRCAGGGCCWEGARGLGHGLQLDGGAGNGEAQEYGDYA
jgi:hypothetical protein